MSSQQLPPPPTSSSWTTQLSDSANLTSALKWGVIVAAGSIVIGFLLNLLTLAVANVGGGDVTKDPVLLVPSCLGIFILAFGIYVAGYLPANERGNIATGVAGSVVMLILLALEKVIEGRIQGTSSSGTGSVAIQIFSILLLAAVLVSIGWVGAFYGVKRRVKAEAKA